jgi:hypothetical protein
MRDVHLRVREVRTPRRAVLLLLALSLAACGEPGAAGPAPAPTPDDAYARASALVYEGGLAAGRRAGHTVHRDGRLEIWTRDPAVREGAPVVERSLRLDPSVAAGVFAAARQARLLEIDLRQEDPFGTAMELIGPEGTHRVAWARAADAPAALRPVADAIARLEATAR